jgi:hypothetical protein
MTKFPSWICSFLAAWCVSQDVRAQDFGKDTSLRLIPVDADLYVGSYRQSEQWNQFLSEPFVKKLLDLPVVQENLEEFQQQWKNREGASANIRMVWDNPNFKEALQFLQQIAKDEWFFFADKSMSSMLRATAAMNEEFQAIVSRQAAGDDLDASEVFDKLIDGVESFVIPTTVIGARCEDEDLAITKVDQLEAAIQLGASMAPDASKLVRLLKRVEDSRGSRLTIELSGKLIPWELVPITDGFDEEARDNLKDVLNRKSIAITIGTLDKYFLVGFSERSKDILNLGKSASLLEHPDMAPVQEGLKKPIFSINYVSDSFALANFDSQLKNFFSKNFSNLLLQVEGQTELSDELQDLLGGIRADLHWMDDAIGQYVPTQKGSASYKYFTPEGWEQMTYNRTKDVLQDGSKPLSLLQHVGGDPLMMLVSRLQNKPEYFQLMRQIVQRFKKHLDTAMTTDLENSDELKKAKPVLDMAWPLLVRLADAWESKFLPAFGGEHGIVMHATHLAAKQWWNEMPSSDVPLPLPEIALISEVNDVAKIKDGFKEVISVCDEVVDLARKADPDFVPSNYRIPQPSKSESAAGEKIGYPIPDDCPAPKTMMPHGLFAGRNLYLAYSEKQSELVAQSSELKIGRGVIDSSLPLASASYLNIGQILAAGKPWLRYALMQSQEDLDRSLIDSDVDELSAYAITSNDVLSIWNALESIGKFSSVTTIQKDGSTILRSAYAR